MSVEQANRDSKKRLQRDDHRRLGGHQGVRSVQVIPTLAQACLTNFTSSDFLGAAVGVQTKLAQSPPRHVHPNILALKAAVLEIGSLVDRLSAFPGPATIKTRERIEDRKLGWDGIVRGPTRTREVQRPMLTL